MYPITKAISLSDSDLTFTFMASPGPGGQNVNKVASAVLMRFAVMETKSLPEPVRLRLIAMLGNKITARGDFIIKASRFRTQERNKMDAIDRLRELIKRVLVPPKKRKKTKPTLGSQKRRLDKKKLHGQKKALRHNLKD